MLKNKIRILFWFMIMIMMLSFNYAFANTNYTDIQKHWAQSEIEKWSNLEILKGFEGLFRPDDNITRGEMAVILDRVLQFVDKAENKFVDLPQDFYTDAILKANYVGVMLGDAYTAEPIVRPIDKITRQEAVVMICRALSIDPSKIENKFLDKDEMADYSIEYINAMTEKGYINGYGDTFKPLDNITRAEVVKILDNTIAKIYNNEGTYSEDIDGLVIINTPNVTLEEMTIKGDLIISEGVGEEEVYLKDIIVNGNVYARGGGENSVYISGDSNIKNLFISKSSSGGIRISVDDGCTVKDINVDKGENIILTGKFANISLNVNANIDLVDASLDSLNVKADDVKVNIDKNTEVKDLIIDNKIKLEIKGSVGNLQVNKDAKETQIIILDTGNVDELVTDAKVTVNNDGKINKATVNANEVVISGDKPKTVEVDKSVDVKPVDNKGTEVTTTPTTKPSTGGGSSKPSIPTINVETELTTKTNALFAEFYDKPTNTTLSPTDAQYYIQVDSNLSTMTTSVKIGSEIFGIENVSVSMGNNNFINLPAWKIDENKNLLIAIPVLALEASPSGTVSIDIGADNSVEIMLTVSNAGTQLSIVSAKACGNVPAGYKNTVEYDRENNKVTQTVNHGHGYLGILLNDGTNNITDKQKVFTKKVYKNEMGEITSLSYGVTETEGNVDSTIGFYAAGWKDGPFLQEEVMVRNIDYKVAVVGKGTVNISIEVNRTSLPTVNIGTELITKIDELFTKFYNQPTNTTLSPTDEQYYIQIANNLSTKPARVKLGTEIFGTENVSVSMGNNNFINLPAWKVDENNNLLFAIPILLLEVSPDGTGTDGGTKLSIVSAKAFGNVPEGYENIVVCDSENNKVTQTVNHGHGYLGILLNDGTNDITDKQKVFTKKVYKNEIGEITSLSYGVTETEGNEDSTIGFYAAGWKDGAFSVDQVSKRNIEYKVAIIGKGTVNILIEVNRTSKETTRNVETELTTKTNALFTEFYDKPTNTTLSPTDAQYYIQVASNLSTKPTSVKIGSEIFGTENVSVSMGNNNFINLPAWKIDENENLLIAIPVLALESSPSGTVSIDIGADNSVEIMLTVSNAGTQLSIVSAKAFGNVPEGYKNTVEYDRENNKVTQTVNHGHGYLGILLNDGTNNITDKQKVFTKKVYKNEMGEITSLSYGVTETEGNVDSTIGFYAAGWKDGAFSVDQVSKINIDYKVAVVGKGTVNIPIEVNRTSKETTRNVEKELTTKTNVLFKELYNKSSGATLQPNNDNYYFKVASNLTTTPDSIIIGRIGGEHFLSNDKVKVSMGNNNFVEELAWKIDESKNLWVAIPVLALEATETGEVVIELFGESNGTITLITAENEEKILTLENAVALYTNRLPSGYTNNVVLESGTTNISQTIDYGTGALGLLLSDGTKNITDLREVFTKKVYTNEEGDVQSISYGVTMSEGTSEATVGFYASGYIDGPYTTEDTVYISYKVGIIGVGSIDSYLTINKTVKQESIEE